MPQPSDFMSSSQYDPQDEIADLTKASQDSYHDSFQSVEDDEESEDSQESDDPSAQGEVEMNDSECQTAVSFDVMDPQWLLSEPLTTTSDQKLHFLQTQHDL